MAEKIDPSKLKVSELKAELAARGADNSGLKSDLVARLQQILDDEEEFGDIPGGDEPVAAATEEAAIEEEEAVAEDAEAVPAPTAKKAKKDDTATASESVPTGDEAAPKLPLVEKTPFEADEATKALMAKAAARAARFGIPDAASAKILAGAEEAEKEAARETKRLAKVAKRQEFFAAQKEKKNALKAEKKAAREAMEAVAAAEAEKQKARAARFGGAAAAATDVEVEIPVGVDADALS